MSKFDTVRTTAFPLAVAGFVSLLFFVFFYVFGGRAGIEDPGRLAQFYVSLFKFYVGLFGIAASFYLYYGPELYRAGVFRRLMPVDHVRVSYPVTLFSLGVAAIMMGAEILGSGSVEGLFWELMGHIMILSLMVGLLVRKTRLSDSDWRDNT